MLAYYLLKMFYVFEQGLYCGNVSMEFLGVLLFQFVCEYCNLKY